MDTRPQEDTSQWEDIRPQVENGLKVYIRPQVDSQAPKLSTQVASRCLCVNLVPDVHLRTMYTWGLVFTPGLVFILCPVSI